MPREHAFRADRRIARKSNFNVALIIFSFFLLIGLLISIGRPFWLVLPAFGFGIGSYFLLEFRVIIKGLYHITVTDDEVIVENGADIERMKWIDMRKAYHTINRGERWIFYEKEGREKLVFLPMGYGDEESERIDTLIREQLDNHTIELT